MRHVIDTHVGHVIDTHVRHVIDSHVGHVIDSHVRHVIDTHVRHVRGRFPAVKESDLSPQMRLISRRKGVRSAGVNERWLTKLYARGLP